MIDSADNLLCFEHFAADKNLPKYRERRDADPGSIYLQADDFDMARLPRLVVRPARVEPVGFWTRLWFKLFPRRHYMSVQEFFESVKNSPKEIEIIEERAAGFEKALMRAHETGQTALLEQLQAGLNAYRQETQLLSLGKTKYIDESSVVKFYKLSDRGLRLDWIANYTRSLPEDIVETKIRCDSLGIFDNYVVLHYDPKKKAYAETAKEREAKKDPILFGLIRGRRQLYFVGDWIDENCDLTLDQIVDKLGKETVKTL